MLTKVSIVIPVYNEEKLIGETLKQVVKADTLGLAKEIIVVDDGSTDKTSANLKVQISKCKSLRRSDSTDVGGRSPIPTIVGQNVNIELITKPKNEGKGAALKTGFLKTTGDIVIVQDADLEYSPSEYPLLLSPFIEKQADVVYGSRFISNRPHRILYFWHYVVNVSLTILSNMFTNLNLTDMETGFKVFNGNLIRNLAKKLRSQRFGFEPEITALIAKVKGIRIYEIGISYAGRTYEEGKKIHWIDGIKAVAAIIRFNLFS